LENYKKNKKGEAEMSISVDLDKKNKILTIKMPLENPRPSASGKTQLIASTRGVKTAEISYLGHPVSVVANAFYYSDRVDKRTSHAVEPVGDDEVIED
jgi:hypothetical protein